MDKASIAPNTTPLTHGHIVRTYRTLHGWSQTQLAESCGVSLDMIKSVEQGRRSMSVNTVQRIITALAIPPHILGLGSLPDTTTNAAAPDGLSPDDYETILTSSWQLFYSGKTMYAIPTVMACLKALGARRTDPRWLAVCGRFHQLAGVLACDGSDNATAMLHGVMAVDAARQLGRVDTLAAALVRLARTCQQFDQRDRAVALMHEAHSLAPQCQHPIRGWLSVMRVKIDSRAGVGTMHDMQRLIGRATTDLANNPGRDESFTTLNKSAIWHAESIARVYRREPMRDSLALLDMAQRAMPSDAYRWRVAMQAMESLAYAVGGDAHAAVDIANDVVQLSTAHPHIRTLRTGYRVLLANSTVKNDPSVTRLGVLLQGR